MNTGKYIFAREWGFGFWSDMSHVLAVLLVAEMTDRVPIIYWGNNSLFRDRSDSKNRNAFDRYWEPLNQADICNVTDRDLTFYPKDWNADKCTLDIQNNAKGRHARCTGEEFLNRNEDVIVSTRHFDLKGLVKFLSANSTFYGATVAEIYRTLWHKHLRPRSSIVSRVQKFINENLSGVPFVSVHARGSDKVDEVGDGLTLVTKYYFDILDPVKEKSEWRIFVLTESDLLLNQFKDRYGDLVVATDFHRTSGEIGIHYLQHVSGSVLGEEVLTDTLIALHGDRFIGNGLSNVSCAIDVFKKWQPGTSGLIVANQWTDNSRADSDHTKPYPEFPR